MEIKPRFLSRASIFLAPISGNRNEEWCFQIRQLAQALRKFVSIHFRKTDID